jgi:hypothetical protein
MGGRCPLPASMCQRVIVVEESHEGAVHMLISATTTGTACAFAGLSCELALAAVFIAGKFVSC